MTCPIKGLNNREKREQILYIEHTQPGRAEKQLKDKRTARQQPEGPDSEQRSSLPNFPELAWLCRFVPNKKSKW